MRFAGPRLADANSLTERCFAASCWGSSSVEAGEPFAQLSCQAFEAPDETCMWHLKADQASAERAGIDWLAKMTFAAP